MSYRRKLDSYEYKILVIVEKVYIFSPLVVDELFTNYKRFVSPSGCPRTL